MLERYGVEVNAFLYHEFIGTIQKKPVEKAWPMVYLKKQTNSRIIFVLNFEDQLIPIVYSKSMGELVSALPKDAYQTIGSEVFLNDDILERNELWM